MHKLTLSVLWLLAALSLAIACATTPAQYEGLVSSVSDAVSPRSEEGTTISHSEGERIRKNTPSAPVDWIDVARTVGEVGLAIIGVKILPGSMLNGPWDARKPRAP